MNLLVFILALAGSWLGSFFSSYHKKKGENYANKEDFDSLKEQLSINTGIVERIKSHILEKNWIFQQAWLKKQEAYESIFELLFHVKRYISHQSSEYEEWELMNHNYPELACEEMDDGKLIRVWELEKEEYEKKVKSPAGLTHEDNHSHLAPIMNDFSN